MGLFDSERYKERMAEVTRRNQERKDARDAAQADRQATQDLAALEKFGLNFDAYDRGTIKQKNLENLRRIARDLIGNKWFKVGMALSFAKGEEQAKVTYLSALVEQNWILIRQQEQMIQLLERVAGGTSEAAK